MNYRNENRATRAAKAIAAAGYTDQDLECQSAVADLLTDLRHLADAQEFDFDAAVETSAVHHATEVREDAIVK